MQSKKVKGLILQIRRPVWEFFCSDFQSRQLLNRLKKKKKFSVLFKKLSSASYPPSDPTAGIWWDPTGYIHWQPLQLITGCPMLSLRIPYRLGAVTVWSYLRESRPSRPTYNNFPLLRQKGKISAWKFWRAAAPKDKFFRSKWIIFRRPARPLKFLSPFVCIPFYLRNFFLSLFLDYLISSPKEVCDKFLFLSFFILF